jgi:quercetin dioxygenase-like cupin family protein
VLLAVSAAVAQDPVKVDPKHNKVEFENEQVRVLRVRVGPHEKSPMHEHPAYVSVFLTDVSVKHTYPDGKADVGHGQAGGTVWSAGVKHAGENLSDKPAELIVVELKAKPAAKK